MLYLTEITVSSLSAMWIITLCISKFLLLADTHACSRLQ